MSKRKQPEDTPTKEEERPANKAKKTKQTRGRNFFSSIFGQQTLVESRARRQLDADFNNTDRDNDMAAAADAVESVTVPGIGVMLLIGLMIMSLLKVLELLSLHLLKNKCMKELKMLQQ